MTYKKKKKKKCLLSHRHPCPSVRVFRSVFASAFLKTLGQQKHLKISASNASLAEFQVVFTMLIDSCTMLRKRVVRKPRAIHEKSVRECGVGVVHTRSRQSLEVMVKTLDAFDLLISHFTGKMMLFISMFIIFLFRQFLFLRHRAIGRF